MGLSGGTRKTTSTSTTKPVYESQILGAYGNVNDAFNANAGNVSGIQSQLQGLLGTAIGRVNNNPTLDAAKGYVTSTLGQTYGSSPELDNLINMSNRNIANATTTALGTRGLTGGSQVAKILAGKLADNETGLRYQDLTNFQNRQAQAAGMAPGLSSADAQGLASAQSLADQTANLSTDQALKRAQAIGGLLGGYTNSNGTETTKTKSFGEFLSNIGKIASAASAFSDARLKENIRRVGQTDSGLPVYTYNYKGDATPQMGVMAQDVAVMQPEALGPVVHGFATVRYGEVR